MQTAAVQFRNTGKKYYFSYENLEINIKDKVVVETVKGLEIGTVKLLKEVFEEEVISALKPILRIATEDDLKTSSDNEVYEIEVLSHVKTEVRKLNLDMKVLAAEFTLDRKKLTIHFESEQRIDFRELLKVLNQTYFKSKIELRQVSPRDAAKMIGAIGPCGLILCCETFIGEFESVSIKMAKNQNIALNPQKISGVCGKLLCCIKYEDDVYTELKQIIPDINQKVETSNGLANVIGINVLGQKVKVKYLEEELPIAWLGVDEVKVKNA